MKINSRKLLLTNDLFAGLEYRTIIKKKYKYVKRCKVSLPEKDPKKKPFLIRQIGRLKYLKDFQVADLYLQNFLLAYYFIIQRLPNPLLS